MVLLLGVLLFSFIITSICIVPFINLLYRLNFQRKNLATKDAFGKLTPIFDYFHKQKTGTPIGGGLLTISLVILMFALLMPAAKMMGVTMTHIYPQAAEIFILLFTFISFGLLGLYDDVLKFFRVEKTGFFGLRLRHKFIIQWFLALFIGFLLYHFLHISILNIPFIGVLKLGIWFIPLTAFIIVSFTNAVNITDGLDGLASGLLLVSLFCLWILASAILDTPLSIFLSLWIGSLIAFLYFNVFPARLMMGDVGSLAFGATMAVVGILVGKIMAVGVIGGLFAVEMGTSLLQLLSKRYRGKKLFPVAPLHLWLQLKGWEEPKIVMRAWLAAIILAVFGLWLALI